MLVRINTPMGRTLVEQSRVKRVSEPRPAASPAALPSGVQRQYRRRDKVGIVAAVRRGDLSFEVALERFALSAERLSKWMGKV